MTNNRIYKYMGMYECHDVQIEFGKYSNGRIAIQLIAAKTGEPFITATVNIPDVELNSREVIIKNYSENEGVLGFLMDNNIVGPVKKEVNTGFVSCQIVDLFKL